MSKSVMTMWVCVLVMVLGASAIVWAAPLGTGVTYQGRLTDQGNPADGEYDFVFRLFDAPSDGTQVSQTLRCNNVSVTDGYFTVTLEFWNIFQGDARWLEISVRMASSVDFTPARVHADALCVICPGWARQYRILDRQRKRYLQHEQRQRRHRDDES